eukprot:413803_1
MTCRVCCRGNIFALFCQCIVTLCSLAASLTIIDVFQYIDLDLSNSLRAIIILIVSSVGFLVSILKVSNRYLTSTDDKAIFTAYKAVFIDLTDSSFDVFAAIAILNTSSKYQSFIDATSFYFIFGTIIGTTDELIELCVEVTIAIAENFCTGLMTCVMIFEYLLCSIEILFGLQIATEVDAENRDAFVTAMIAVYVILIFLIIMWCWFMTMFNTDRRILLTWLKQNGMDKCTLKLLHAGGVKSLDKLRHMKTDKDINEFIVYAEYKKLKKEEIQIILKIITNLNKDDNDNTHGTMNKTKQQEFATITEIKPLTHVLV